MKKKLIKKLSNQNLFTYQEVGALAEFVIIINADPYIEECLWWPLSGLIESANHCLINNHLEEGIKISYKI